MIPELLFSKLTNDFGWSYPTCPSAEACQKVVPGFSSTNGSFLSETCFINNITNT